MRVLVAGWLLTCALLTESAYAQPSEDVKTAARSLLDEGDRRLQRNDVVGALDAYAKADALMHVPTTTIDVAKAQARLGRLLAARESARAVLAFPKDTQEPEPFTAARREAAELIAAIGPRIPSVVVVASGPEPGAMSLSIDGTLRDPHATHELDPGRHEILVRAAGFADAKRTLEISEGARIKIALALESRPMPYVPLIATGSVATGIGLALGLGFGAVSWVKTGDIEDRCPGGKCDPSLASDISEAEAFANVSNVGFGFAGAGAVMVAVGLGLYLTQDDTLRATATGLALDF